MSAGGGQPPPELADILRAHAHQLPALSPQQAKAVWDITRCRTAALGGHVYACSRCGHQEISYNSCRNRHCPKCQALATARWLEARKADLLPVPYFHVVFTVPHTLHPLFLAAPKIAYALLLAAAAETLKEVALNPKHLGAEVGFLAVLHTWTQQLDYHPHLHCVVPAGGLHPDHTRWVASRPNFFLPVKVLSPVFRGKLLAKLEQALHTGRILPPQHDGPTLLRKAARTSWVVYSKPPFAGPEKVLDYVARYTHRVAIANHRLVSLRDGHVTFRYRDRADGDKLKTLTLPAKEFLLRFVLHVLPKGFQRLRHYGFLANGCKTQRLALCRRLLPPSPPNASQTLAQPASVLTWQELLLKLTGTDPTVCPQCGGELVLLQRLPPLPPGLPP